MDWDEIDPNLMAELISCRKAAADIDATGGEDGRLAGIDLSGQQRYHSFSLFRFLKINPSPFTAPTTSPT